MSAYNKVIGDLNTQFQVNATTNQAGPLQADSTLALAQIQILSTVSFAMIGNGGINSLADLGVSMNNDGTLSVNSATLQGALQANPSAVQSFFNSQATGSFGSNLYNQINFIADPISGSVSQDMAGMQQSQTALSQQISDFQGQLSVTQQQLTTEYDQVDVTLQELPLLLQQINQQLASLP